MKIVFTSQKSVNGVRVYAVDVEAKKKSDRNIRSGYIPIYGSSKSAYNPLLDPTPVRVVNGVEYLNV